MLNLHRLDHLVLTVSNIERTCDFYNSVLGCEVIRFKTADSKERVALRIGNSPQKINLHPAENSFQPAAQLPTPGSADLCFITLTPLEAVIQHLQSLQIPIIEGPVQRTGTLGPILSVYIRDPDGNLIEVANADRDSAVHRP
ncbi:MAG: VOC family protein [Cyanobacteria bacterium P01_D01_bin.105]